MTQSDQNSLTFGNFTPIIFEDTFSLKVIRESFFGFKVGGLSGGRGILLLFFRSVQLNKFYVFVKDKKLQLFYLASKWCTWRNKMVSCATLTCHCIGVSGLNSHNL